MFSIFHCSSALNTKHLKLKTFLATDHQKKDELRVMNYELGPKNPDRFCLKPSTLTL